MMLISIPILSDTSGHYWYPIRIREKKNYPYYSYPSVSDPFTSLEGADKRNLTWCKVDASVSTAEESMYEIKYL